MARRIHDVTPRIILLFLVSKDASASTIVHVEECEGLLGAKPARFRPEGCTCPSRAAAASVKKTIASLSTLFQSEGMTSPWNPRDECGNPASAMEVNRYLRAVNREQADARVRTKQAPTIRARCIRVNYDSGLGARCCGSCRYELLFGC